MTIPEHLALCDDIVRQKIHNFKYVDQQLTGLILKISNEFSVGAQTEMASKILKEWIENLKFDYEDRIRRLRKKLKGLETAADVVKQRNRLTDEILKLSDELINLVAVPTDVNDESSDAVVEINKKMNEIYVQLSRLNVSEDNPEEWRPINDYNTFNKLINESPEIIQLEKKINEVLRMARKLLKKFRFVRQLKTAIQIVAITIGFLLSYMIGETLFNPVQAWFNIHSGLKADAVFFALAGSVFCFSTTDKLIENFRTREFWKYAEIINAYSKEYQQELNIHKQEFDDLILKYSQK